MTNLLQEENCLNPHFSNGAVFAGDVLIGCDGNASTVRNLVFHDSPVGYSGQAAYRAMIPMEDVPEAIFATPNVLWPGRGAMLLHYPVSRSEEHTSELQSLMRISYAVFCLKKK